MARPPDEDRFRPRPAKPRGGKTGARRFTSQVLKAAQQTGGGVRSRVGRSNGRRFEGGRGRAAARLLSDRIGPRDRRVVVKARLVILAKASPRSTAAHLRYIQRDGVTPEGEPGRAYGPTTDAADAEGFEARGRDDRHQFRFIVSAEDAAEIGDLKAFTRDLLGRMEADLGTRLDWVAVDHFDTDNPHSHVVLRGVDDQGRDLVIARDYIAHGLRLRASALATEMLGPQTERDLRERLAREVDAERWTGLDRRLVDRSDSGVIGLGAGDDRALTGRVRTLERLGLAEPLDGARWRLRADLEPTLQAMGERGDIVRTLQRAFAGESRPLEILHQDGAPGYIIGRIVRKGLADELGDRGFLVLDGLDGKGRYVTLPPGAELADFPRGGVVRVRATPDGPRPADRTIAEVAEDEVYRPDRHLALAHAEARTGDDPATFVEAHVRRLEALRRAGVVERVDAQHWRLPRDFLNRAAAYDAGRFGGVRVEVLDTPLARQARLLGATWLDQALIDDLRPAPSDFGAEVRRAFDDRRVFLREQGFAERRGATWRLAPDLLASLRQRELKAIGARLAAETELEHRLAEEGSAVRGTYRRSLTLVSGRFAMIDDGMGFSLVPWRPVLEKRLGQSVSGVVRGSGVQWTFGRERGI